MCEGLFLVCVVDNGGPRYGLEARLSWRDGAVVEADIGA